MWDPRISPGPHPSDYPSTGLLGSQSCCPEPQGRTVFLANQDAAQRFCPLNPKSVPGGATCNLIAHPARIGRISPSESDEEQQELRPFIKATVEPEEKRPFVAQRAYLYTRPRLLGSPSADNKSALKTNPKPGRRFGAAHCIVGSFNTRVQLLRTKQRLQIRRNVGCWRSRSVRLQRLIYHRSPSETRTIIPVQPRPAVGFACCGLGLALTLFFPLPYLD